MIRVKLFSLGEGGIKLCNRLPLQGKVINKQIASLLQYIKMISKKYDFSKTVIVNRYHQLRRVWIPGEYPKSKKFDYSNNLFYFTNSLYPLIIF
jgi:hypothetical protein